MHERGMDPGVVERASRGEPPCRAGRCAAPRGSNRPTRTTSAGSGAFEVGIAGQRHQLAGLRVVGCARRGRRSRGSRSQNSAAYRWPGSVEHGERIDLRAALAPVVEAPDHALPGQDRALVERRLRRHARRHVDVRGLAKVGLRRSPRGQFQAMPGEESLLRGTPEYALWPAAPSPSRWRTSSSRPPSSRSSPRCSCTAAGCTSPSTCSSCGSSATTSRTRWDGSATSSSTCSGALRPRARRSPCPRRDRPLVGASGAIAAVLGGYALLYPRARVLTLFFFFFIFFLEIPALVLLGLWIFLQFLPAVGQLAHARARRAAAASPTGPTSAASCSAWRRSSCSRSGAAPTTDRPKYPVY